jgi:hypothetical protein
MSHGVHKGGGARTHRHAGGLHGEMLLVVDSLGSYGGRIEGRAKDGEEGIPSVLSSVSPCRAIESRRARCPSRARQDYRSPSAEGSRVEPSMSVKRNVTGATGRQRSGINGLRKLRPRGHGCSPVSH